jgi:ubiquitin carboxyl-terminal hydrolase 31
VSRETLYGDLQKLLMKEMAPILHDDILIGSQKVPLFKIRIIDGFDDPSYLDSSVDLPMYTLAIEQVKEV